MIIKLSSLNIISQNVIIIIIFLMYMNNNICKNFHKPFSYYDIKNKNYITLYIGRNVYCHNSTVIIIICKMSINVCFTFSQVKHRFEWNCF